MFEQADTKSKRQTTEINVSMTHGGSPDYAKGTSKLKGKHFKSKIGSNTAQGLSVPGSKAAKLDKQAPASALNSEKTTELQKFLEAKEVKQNQYYVKDKGLKVSHQDYEAKSHIFAQRQEA